MRSVAIRTAERLRNLTEEGDESSIQTLLDDDNKNKEEIEK